MIYICIKGKLLSFIANVINSYGLVHFAICREIFSTGLLLMSATKEVQQMIAIGGRF